jgi:hypothetical protein
MPEQVAKKRCPLSFSTPDYTAQECMENDCGWYCEKTERCAIVSIAGQLIHIRQNVLEV